MSSSSYVRQEIAKINKANEEKERLSGKGESSKQSRVYATLQPKKSSKHLTATQQYPARTEEPRPKPKTLPRPSFKNDFNQPVNKPAQDYGKIQKTPPSVSSDIPPRPLPPQTLPPPPPVSPLPHEINGSYDENVETPSVSSLSSNLPSNESHLPSTLSNLPSRPLQRIPSRSSSPEPPPPPPPRSDLPTQEDYNADINKPPALPSLTPSLPLRPPQRPPPPPNTPPPAPPKSLPIQNISEQLPSATKEAKTSTIIHRSNSNRIPDEDSYELIKKGPPGHDKPARPTQSYIPGTPIGTKSSNAHLVADVLEKEGSVSRFEEREDFSAEYASPDEYEKEPEPSGGRSAQSYQVSNAEERREVSQSQLELTDSDEDWDEDWSEDECDLDDAAEVQIRHKKGTHGLVTKTLNDAIAINDAMKYVSGFFDLPDIEETNEKIGGVSRSTVEELEKETQKILWKDLPVVKCNLVFRKMNTHKRKLHESIFEIMSTEALFISLLNSFEDQKSYYPSEEVMATSDRDMLFSRLLLVKQCAESFFEELEGCWQESIFLHGVFDIIEKHATNNFGAYVKYCTNQGRINKMFLKAQKSSGILSPQLKAFQSFLILPMQRITTLPSLVESILQQMSVTDKDYPACKRALTAIRKRATECNEDIQSGDRMGGLLELSSHIVFPDTMPPFPLISASRWLRKRSQATLRWRQDVEDDKATSKEDLEMFLFNDVFFICSRKRRDDSYLVQSYCRHSLLEMTPVNGEYLPSLPSRYAVDRPGKYVFVVDILSNQNESREIMVMSMRSQQERDSWLQAAPPPPIPDPSSDICYEPWDCPVVVALLPFKAVTPYQLSLELHDKMHVTKRKTIGWYEGERLSDRKTGFFPVNSTMEIDSPHKRAREIRESFYPVDEK